MTWALLVVSSSIGAITALMSAWIIHSLTVRRTSLDRSTEAYGSAVILKEQFSALLHNYSITQMMETPGLWGGTIDKNRDLFYSHNMTLNISKLISIIETHFPHVRHECKTAINCIYAAACLNIYKTQDSESVSEEWQELRDVFDQNIESVCKALSKKI